MVPKHYVCNIHTGTCTYLNEGSVKRKRRLKLVCPFSDDEEVFAESYDDKTEEKTTFATATIEPEGINFMVINPLDYL